MGNYDGTSNGEAEVPILPSPEFPVLVIGFIVGNPNGSSVTGTLYFRSQNASRAITNFTVTANSSWTYFVEDMPLMPGQSWTVKLSSKPTTELTLLGGWK